MRLSSLLPAVLGFTSAVLAASDGSRRATTACNNSPDLCNKPYGSITHLGAHDSPFVRDSTTRFSTSGNQYYNSTVQLSAGVRLLSAQVHKSNGGWHLCHSACDLLDMGLLSAWLKEIKTWMDNNPNEVVTVLLVNSDKATPTDLHNEFVKSGINSYAYTPPSISTAPAPSSWPTLQSLIAANTRLMVFVASVDLTKATPEMYYLMTEFLFIFENPFENLKFADFSCDPNRPQQLTVQSALGSNRMPLMNHFLYASYGGLLSDVQVPDVGNISTTNSPSTSLVGSLGAAVDNCTSVYGGKPPTFILVDFFDEGPAIQTVDRLNGVTNPVGRKAVPPRDKKTAGNTASWVGVQALVAQVQSGETPKLGAWIWGAGKWTLGGINLNGGDVLT